MEAVLFGNASPAHQEIIEILIGAGADPAIADFDGVAPAQHAANRGHQGIVDIRAAAQ